MADARAPEFDMEAARAKRARTGSVMVIGGAIGAVVSAFLPWVSLGPFSATGIDGDGQITLILGAVVIVLWFTRLKHMGSKIATWFTIEFGGLITAIGIYHFDNLGNVGSVGMGVYGTIAAGIVTFIGGIQTLRHPMTPVMPATAPPAAVEPPPAGWHPDPFDPSLLRYWDGKAWTDHTARPE